MFRKNEQLHSYWSHGLEKKIAKIIILTNKNTYALRRYTFVVRAYIKVKNTGAK